jgi:hypothetical protein
VSVCTATPPSKVIPGYRQLGPFTGLGGTPACEPPISINAVRASD